MVKGRQCHRDDRNVREIYGAGDRLGTGDLLMTNLGIVTAVSILPRRSFSFRPPSSLVMSVLVGLFPLALQACAYAGANAASLAPITLYVQYCTDLSVT